MQAWNHNSIRTENTMANTKRTQTVDRTHLGERPNEKAEGVGKLVGDRTAHIAERPKEKERNGHQNTITATAFSRFARAIGDLRTSLLLLLHSLDEHTTTGLSLGANEACQSLQLATSLMADPACSQTRVVDNPSSPDRSISDAIPASPRLSCPDLSSLPRIRDPACQCSNAATKALSCPVLLHPRR